MARWIKVVAALFTGLTGLSCLLILAMVTIILGNIAIHGWPSLSWTFLSTAPSAHLGGGAVFPAIFGTVALVLLMTIAVVPLGVAQAEPEGQDVQLPVLVQAAAFTGDPGLRQGGGVSHAP
jgi:ABC-type phosphate transport system permease subunit